MPVTDIETRLATLEAKEEIREFIARYCGFNDRLDQVPQLIELFAEEAVMRNNLGSYHGKQAIFDYYNKFFDGTTKFARHQVMNQVITLLTPDKARHEAYFLAMLGREGDSLIIYGQYNDTLIKRDGRWLFLEKINDSVARSTPSEGWAEGFAKHVPLEATV